MVPEAKGDKTAAAANAAIGELVKRVGFYEQQLAEADETLLQAKTMWSATSAVQGKRIEALEKELATTTAKLQEAEEAMGVDGQEVGRLRSLCERSEKRAEKLSEMMSKFEIDLIQVGFFSSIYQEIFFLFFLK